MNVIYSLSDGSKLYGFYWEDFEENKETFHEIEVRHELSRDIETSHKVLKDESGKKFFIYNGEKIYVDDYEYHHISILVDEIKYGIDHNDRWFVDNNIILTSLMKQPDKFGFYIKARTYSTVIPMMGIALINNDKRTDEPILYIPKITEMDYPGSWHYKISLHTKDEKLRRFCASERYYFSDLCSLLKAGIIELVELK